jgi:hypothetical protein
MLERSAVNRHQHREERSIGELISSLMDARATVT